jgi:hypothetical protein
MASFGASCAAGGFAWGRLSDVLPRKVILFISFLLGSVGLGLASVASSQRSYLFFITMIIFGFGDAALQVQTSAILGSFHPQNSQAAFGCKLDQTRVGLANEDCSFQVPPGDFNSSLFLLQSTRSLSVLDSDSGRHTCFRHRMRSLPGSLRADN